MKADLLIALSDVEGTEITTNLKINHDLLSMYVVVSMSYCTSIIRDNRTKLISLIYSCIVTNTLFLIVAGSHTLRKNKSCIEIQNGTSVMVLWPHRSSMNWNRNMRCLEIHTTTID